MKILSPLIIAVFSLPVITHAKSLQSWEQCIERVGKTIDIAEVGNIGYEQEVVKQCGTRPIVPIEINKLGDKLPFDVIQAAPWKEKFQKLTQKDYKNIQTALTVSSSMQPDGDWMIGHGHDPQGGNTSKAVIAINTKTAKVLAVYADVTGVRNLYGFNENSKDVPQKLLQWLSDETGVG
ncbi:hypothetical protein [Acinetobacter rudis]|uniref:hypothetical protein n=1 Tax=Acinetobacter rudis TaxID=632955 RepID=UPI0033423748